MRTSRLSAPPRMQSTAFSKRAWTCCTWGITRCVENSLEFRVSSFGFRTNSRLTLTLEREGMATFKRFVEIECWRKARELTNRIYDASGKASFARDFGLRDQIRRASVSVMSNIAEGYDRSGTAEFVHFLATAKGS